LSAGTRYFVKKSVSVNVVANYAGVAWSTIVQLVLVPINIKLLGVEQYGLIGFWVTLISVLLVLDLGLTPTINRELARRSALGAHGHESADLVRTLEGVYWGVAVILGIAVVAASSYMASRWISAKEMRPEDVRAAVAMMGLTVALQWPISLYGGGLQGLERQVLMVVIGAVMNAIFAVGTVLILVFVWRSVHAFFAWRAVLSFVHVLVLRHLLWRSLRPDAATAAKPRFRLQSLKGVWRFSMGMTGMGITAAALSQADKVIVSRQVSLEAFAYYMLASSGAVMLTQLVGPIVTSVFPRFAHLVAVRDVEAQRGYLHSCAQLTTVIVCPAAITLALFPHDILALWTRNETMATASAPMLSLLCLGTLLNCVMMMPYVLQVAHGWTRLGTNINVVLICVAVPYTVVATRYYGVVGAATASLMLSTVNFCVGAPLTFRRLLPGEGWGWLRRDVVFPAAACIMACLAVWRFVPRPEMKMLIAGRIALAAALAYAAAVLCSRDVWRQLMAFVRGLRAEASRC
jgi:O-antigen/teichoic acid export membrane protein